MRRLPVIKFGEFFPQANQAWSDPGPLWVSASLPPLVSRRPVPCWAWLVRAGLLLTFLLGLALLGWSVFMNQSALASLIDKQLPPDIIASKAKAAQFAHNWLVSGETGRTFWENGFWAHADLVGGIVAGLALLMLVLVMVAPRGLVLPLAAVPASPGLIVLVGAVVGALIFIVALAATFLMLVFITVAALGAASAGK
jgi:hypothetical protein